MRQKCKKCGSRVKVRETIRTTIVECPKCKRKVYDKKTGKRVR